MSQQSTPSQKKHHELLSTLYIIAFVLLIVVALNNCGGSSSSTASTLSTPTDMVKTYCNAFTNHDFQTMYDLTSSSSLGNRSLQDYTAVGLQEIALHGELISCTIGTPIEDKAKTTANIPVTLNWSKSDPVPSTWSLDYEQGGWKLLYAVPTSA